MEVYLINGGMAFGRKALRRIFGTIKDRQPQEWRILKTEKLIRGTISKVSLQL